jgi:hypothetical protein
MIVSLFLCGYPPLHGEDDTVVDAATRQKTGRGMQLQQIELDQQMNSIFFQGVGNSKLARQKFIDRLLLQVSAVDAVCAASFMVISGPRTAVCVRRGMGRADAAQ